MANVLAELFGNMANAIREKTGGTGTMKPAEFPDQIRAIASGGGVGTLVPLTVTRNGTYYPTKNFEVGKPFLFRNDYTQAELKELYDSSATQSEDGVYAFLFNTEGVTVGIMYQYSCYGVYISNGYIWIPAEVASQLGVSEGWYFGSDLSDITPTDTPFVLLTENGFHLFVDALSDLNPLFEFEKADGFSSVEVDVKIDGEKELLIAKGSYEVSAIDQVLTIAHNLGVVPDVIIVRMSEQIPSNTPVLTFFSATVFSKKMIPNDSTQYAQCFTTTDGSISPATANIDFTTSEGFVHDTGEFTFKVGGTYARHIVGNQYDWIAIGNLK